MPGVSTSPDARTIWARSEDEKRAARVPAGRRKVAHDNYARQAAAHKAWIVRLAGTTRKFRKNRPLCADIMSLGSPRGTRWPSLPRLRFREPESGDSHAFLLVAEFVRISVRFRVGGRNSHEFRYGKRTPRDEHATPPLDLAKHFTDRSAKGDGLRPIEWIDDSRVGVHAQRMVDRSRYVFRRDGVASRVRGKTV